MNPEILSKNWFWSIWLTPYAKVKNWSRLSLTHDGNIICTYNSLRCFQDLWDTKVNTIGKLQGRILVLTQFQTLLNDSCYGCSSSKMWYFQYRFGNLQKLFWLQYYLFRSQITSRSYTRFETISKQHFKFIPLKFLMNHKI